MYEFMSRGRNGDWVWWHIPLIPALWRQRQRQKDPCGFEDSLVYTVNPRTMYVARPCLKRKVRKRKGERKRGRE